MVLCKLVQPLKNIVYYDSAIPFIAIYLEERSIMSVHSMPSASMFIALFIIDPERKQPKYSLVVDCKNKCIFPPTGILYSNKKNQTYCYR